MDYETIHLLLKYGKEFGHRKIRNHGLNDTECLLCSYICKYPGCSQEEAARALLLDKTTAAKALLSLEKKAYISRVRDQKDGRRNVLKVTESATACLQDLMADHDKWVTDVLSCLSPQEQAQFESLVRRVLTEAEKKLAEQEKN